MIMGETESGDLQVLGSGHRASAGVKRGYVTDMGAAAHAIRDAVERAEKASGTPVRSVWIACAGAGLASHVVSVDIEIGGRRIEDEDVEALLIEAQDMIQPDGRKVLHAQPAHYTLDGAHGVANPRGLHAERLGVDIHVMLADGAPVRNLTEAVQNAHLEVEGVVAAPLAAGHACLTPEERELGVALVEIGADITNVAVFAGGMLLGLHAVPMGSGSITDAIASSFGIRRSQAERLKCVAGSAIASPSDHRELIPVSGPGEAGGESGDGAAPAAPLARGADDKNRIVRAELVAVVTQQLGELTGEIGKALKTMGSAAEPNLPAWPISCRVRSGNRCGLAVRRSLRACQKACPKRITRRALRRWRACAFMQPMIPSISARWARGGAGFTRLSRERPVSWRSSNGCSARSRSISDRVRRGPGAA